MGIYIETLILYTVLFLSGSAGALANGAEGPVDFSAAAELTRIFMYNIPSLALIWYLLLKAKKARDWGILPGKKDLLSGALALPCLLIIGIIIAYISSFVGIGGTPARILLPCPSTAAGWVVLCVSCISVGYLEESFFRFYLLSRREELKLGAAAALFLSTALFSICHIYEGPWGFLNSVLSGAVLAFIFLRYKSIHGIALAHGLYNIAVYVIAAAGEH